MRQYEAVLVLQPDLDDAGVQAIVTQVGDLLGRLGGEILSIGQLTDKKGHVSEVADTWSKRRLAYSINGRREGYYAVLQVSAPPEAIDPFEQWLGINENVLRYLTVRSDE